MALKIALVTDGIYPFVVGGMQKHSFYLAKYLAIAKVKVDVYHFVDQTPDYNKLFNEEELEYLQFFEIDYPSRMNFPGHYLYERFVYSSWVFTRLQPRLGEYNFIYCKGFSGWKLLNESLKRNNFPPIGINFHGYEMFQQSPSLKASLQLQLLKIPVKALSRKADVVFSYGGKVTDLILKLGVKEEKILVIPSGIMRDWLVPSPDIKKTAKVVNFVFVGRFERRKGIEEIGEVILKLRKNYNFKFHFIGPIPEKNRLNFPFIYYHGLISDAESMQRLLRQMDVLVCPSHSEGMPNVILEGMASGLAIIASDVGATSLLVHNERNGWLLNPNDIKGNLNNAMIEAIEEKESILYLMKKESLRFVEEDFLWERIIAKTIKLISSVAEH